MQYLPSGTTAAPAPQSVTVPAQSQVTINVRSQYNHLVPSGSRNIGIEVTSDVPVAVDRAMYWGTGAGSGKYGYSLAPGITAGAHSQYFSLLPTSGGSQSFITVLNPNESNTTVTLTLVNSSGGTLKTVTASVSAHARYTFAVPSILSGDNGYLAGGLVSSNLPVVAEAADYFGGSPNHGSHSGTVVQGSLSGQIGARADVNARGGLLQIYNPNSSAERVQVMLGNAVVFDSMVSGNASALVTLPARGSDNGLLVLASDTFVGTLLNGVGDAQVWGGRLN